MIKAAIEKILSLATPNITEINGETYTDKSLERIDKEKRAGTIELNTLSSLVDFIKDMSTDFKSGYCVIVDSPTQVRLVSSLDADRKRETLVQVKAELPDFAFGRYIPNEEFVIAVQSKFLDLLPEKNDKTVLLAFAGNVKSGTVAEYGDTGVGQKATIKKGVASMQEVEVPSPCNLMPFRTFVEVGQPMSSFIFRVKDDKNFGVECALFEADGGAWRNEAKRNIADFLKKELKDNINILAVLS